MATLVSSSPIHSKRDSSALLSGKDTASAASNTDIAGGATDMIENAVTNPQSLPTSLEAAVTKQQRIKEPSKHQHGPLATPPPPVDDISPCSVVVEPTKKKKIAKASQLHSEFHGDYGNYIDDSDDAHQPQFNAYGALDQSYTSLTGGLKANHQHQQSFAGTTSSSMDDSYTYSDDSASLSDAYFYPHSDDEPYSARRLGGSGRLPSHMRYTSMDGNSPYQSPKHQPLPDTSSSPSYPSAATTYGATSASRYTSIAEDVVTEDEIVSEISSLLQSTSRPSIPPTNGRRGSGSGYKKQPRRGRRQSQQQQHASPPQNYSNQSESNSQHTNTIHPPTLSRGASREQAVDMVKGRPQEVSPTTRFWQHPDFVWAMLFILQLSIICVCAVRFGYRLLYHQVPVLPWYDETAAFSSDDDAVSSAAPLPSPSSAHANNMIQYDVVTNEMLYSDKSTMFFNTTGKSVVQELTSDYFAFTIDYRTVVALVSIAGFYSCILTYMSFGFMLVLARALIQITLVVSVLLALAWGLIGLTLDPYGIIAAMGFTALLLTLGYTMYNWTRVPFATTNLHTALTAVRSSADLPLLGFLGTLAALVWCNVWFMAFTGVVNSLNRTECNKADACEPHVAHQDIPICLAMLLSFYWTNNVILNVIRATVASGVGMWWFCPGQLDGSFCSSPPALLKPLQRSLTSSFGSICLGSLVVGPVRVIIPIHYLVNCALSNPDSNCMHPPGHSNSVPKRQSSNLLALPPGDEVESAADSVGLFRRLCSLNDCFTTFLRYSNQWSFSYIGMYGYGFSDAGKRAIQLFETREWLDVVDDSLMQNVLQIVCVIIGGSTATFAVIVEETDGYEFSSFHKPVVSAFLIGFVVGYVLSKILLIGVVGSAVNTVLVCFAAGPFEFDKLHPLLSREMREAWSHHVWDPAST